MTEHQATLNQPGNMHPGKVEDCRVPGCGPIPGDPSPTAVPNDLLRQAADKLDEVTVAAQPVDLTWFEADDDDLLRVMAREDAAYVAAISPPVAKALAAWLRGTSQRHGPVVECGNKGCRDRGLSGLHCPEPCEAAYEDCGDYTCALAVARAVLGETS